MYVVIPDEIPHRRIAHGIFFDEDIAVTYGNYTFGEDKYEAITVASYLHELSVEFTDVHDIYEI